MLRLLSSALLAFAVSATTAVAAPTTNSGVDDTFHRSLSVSSQPDLYVSNGSGNIHVYAGSGNQIEVTGHVHAGWGAFGDVRSRVQHIVDNPPVQQAGNTVRIGETNERSLFNNISIDYDIRVPADVALNLHSGSGDVEVDNVGRFLSAGTGSGNLRARGIHGSANLESGSGDLELQTSGGQVRARTGSGNIRVHGINGSFQAHTGSGDVEADGRISDQSMVSTGSGNVRLHVTPDSHFNIEASTGSGSIRVHLPGITQTDTETSRHHLTMGVNGGGPALQIRTGSGDIEVNPR